MKIKNSIEALASERNLSDEALVQLLENESDPSALFSAADKKRREIYGDAKKGIGEVGNAKCGDIMKIYLKIDKDIITDVKFETFGCGSAIASSSMATELIKGKPVSQALALTNQAVVEALDGLPAHKLHCSVLAEEAIKKALQDYYEKNGLEYDRRRFLDCGDCCVCKEES